MQLCFYFEYVSNNAMSESKRGIETTKLPENKAHYAENEVHFI